MGLADAFGKDDRVTLKVVDVIDIFRNEGKTYAENKVLINGLKANIPAEHILIMIGEVPINTNELNKNIK